MDATQDLPREKEARAPGTTCRVRGERSRHDGRGGERGNHSIHATCHATSDNARISEERYL